MSSGSTPLVGHLSALRKGRGLLEPNLRRRIADQVAVLCGIDDGDDLSTVRDKIVTTMSDLLTRAPAEVRRAVMVALAVEPAAQFPTLTARRDWLAGAVPCDVRTVRRHEDRGFAIAATAAAGRLLGPIPTPRQAGSDWYFTTFRAILRLNGRTPELIEERRIVAVRDQLARIIASVSLPESPESVNQRPVEADILYGARIVGAEYPATSHFRFVLELPRALNRGETHDYGILFRVPEGRLMRPHYAIVPLAPCEAFEVIVKFNPARLPSHVWRLDGVAPRILDSDRPTPDVLRPDDVGEIRLHFTELKQGLGYGMAWIPAAPGDL
jgi:hypothetical protein